MSELIKILSIFNNKLIFVGIVLFFFIIILLLKRNFIKPLKYIGIPSFMVGIFTLIIYLLLPVIINFMGEEINMFQVFIPYLTTNLLSLAIFWLVFGLILIILYNIFKKRFQKTDKIV